MDFSLELCPVHIPRGKYLPKSTKSLYKLVCNNNYFEVTITTKRESTPQELRA